MELKPLNEPKVKTLYPDAGGYTGFSIFVWELELERDWGRMRVYALEGRYFVQGVLIEKKLEIEEGALFVMNAHDALFAKWKPMMDRVTKLSEHEKPN